MADRKPSRKRSHLRPARTDESARRARPETKKGRRPGAARGRAGSPSTRAKTPPRKAGFPVVGVGASAGGLEAFTALLKHLPADTGMAFVLIQHLDPKHASLLTEILSRSTRMPVIEVRDGLSLRKDRVHVVPPAVSVELEGGAFRLLPRAGSGRRDSLIDGFFESLGRQYGNLAIGVILSGSLSDGSLGLKAIKAEGGLTFAEDEASARFPDMPRAAVRTGAVDRVLDPRGIARELARIGKHWRLEDGTLEPERQGKKRAGKRPERAGGETDESALRKIFPILLRATGVDFSSYRPSTLRRRISRRMLINRIAALEDYVDCLEREPSEARALYDDLLITVTGFFRDPEAYDALKARVFPAVLKNRDPHDPVRIWVPGCSTGEESYSIAIALFEYMGEAGSNPPVQIFATDISETAIAKARAGIYPEEALADVSPERRQRFFRRVEGGYQIRKAVRDVCVFARQNVAADPPFSNLDIVSCRNLLIYLEPVLQKKIIPLFHYALEPSGFLLLGRSETLATFPEFFRPIDRNQRIFTKAAGPVRPLPAFRVEPRPSTAAIEPAARPPVTDPQREADRLILSRYTPPSVVVDDSLEIVHFRGRTSPYLEAAPGTASLNVLKMAREGLLVQLRSAILKARRSGQRVRVSDVRVRQDGTVRRIDVEVVPIRAEGGRSHYLIVFDESGQKQAAKRVPRTERAGTRGARDHAVVELEQELQATKEYLQAIIETQEAANEELKTANEEILSSNEELQSTNEELETAKEELQSANEEITTVNEELATRNLEILQINSDLVNLLTSIQTAIVMVDRNLRIRRQTPVSEALLGLRAADAGRPLREVRLPFETEDVEADVHRVLEKLQPFESEVATRDGRWFSMTIRPYRTLDNRIDGAVLVFHDITERKRASEALQASEARYRSLFESAREGVWILDGTSGEILNVNPFFTKLFGYPRDRVVGKKPWEISLYADREEARRHFENVRARGHAHEAEIAMVSSDGRPLRVEAIVSALDLPGHPLIQGVLRDVTERLRLEEDLRRAQKLESIGRLAGGIAHDFNNILNIISAYTTLLARGGDSAKRAQNAEAIDKAVERGAGLVRQLVTFARRDGARFEEVDVNALVREVSSMISETFPKSIRVSVDLDPRLPRIHANPNQLHQALLNLAVNSRDAMPRGGHLKIATAVAAGERLRSRFSEAADERYVCVAVSDDGDGMDGDMQARIFEPFFSTKPEENGSGLGLAVVYGVVNGHQGFIDVASEKGKGSSFSLYLPVRPAGGRRTSRENAIHRGPAAREPDA